MPEEKAMFTVEKKKWLTPAFIGIILGAAVLVVGVSVVILLLGKKAAKFTEGRTVYTGTLYSGDTGFKNYLPYLTIINAEGQVSENLLGDQQAVVVGEITNKGSRQVDVVEIQATLYDTGNKAIQQFVKTPIKPDFPLLPNEIRRFGIWVEPFPKEWLDGRVEVEIHGFRIKS